MNGIHHVTNLFRTFVAMGLLAGCSTGPTQGNPSWTKVQVVDVHPVVGDWEGTITKAHAIFPTGAVRLIIRDNGTYMFAGQTRSDVALGAGELKIHDGEMTGDTEIRAIKLALYDHKGTAVLVVDSTHRLTGDQYHGEFTRAK
ncbi:MAG TPA: hypothetical protein VJ746_05265 [Nitrospira sp.]|nr:hypothetical protein [Nitrospira sp.]